jgi:acyl-CoA synthetase (AMP-forming)/AMP-acid ligase II
MSFFEDIVTLGDVPRFHARHRPAEIALELGECCVDYRTWNRNCSRVAQALLSGGLRPSARIGFIGKNSIEYFEILFGAAKAGIVLVPINWRLAPPEVSFIVNDADIEVLFVDHEFRDLAARAVREFDWKRLGRRGLHPLA